MTKQRGRPADPTRKDKKPTWVMLTDEQRRIINADFGSYQVGLEELVNRYIKEHKNE